MSQKRMTEMEERRALRCFLSILIPASLLLETVYIITASQLIIFFLMWVPGLAAMFTSKLYYKKGRALGWQGSSLTYVLLALIIPFSYLLVSYMLAWLMLGDQTSGLEKLLNTITARMPLLLYLAVSLVFGLGAATGEELGWRGFLYPLLERLYGRARAILISGGIWGIWHLPLIISGLYQSQTNLLYGILTFMLGIFLISITLSWLRSVSASVIPPLLFHGAHNFFDQAIFSPLSTDPKIAYFAGEQGVLTLVCMGILAIILWKRWQKKGSKKEKRVIG